LTAREAKFLVFIKLVGDRGQYWSRGEPVKLQAPADWPPALIVRPA